MNIGDKIPEILGIDQDGREIKASDFRGTLQLSESQHQRLYC